MSIKYTTIESQGQKWLSQVAPHGVDPAAFHANVPDLPYIGNRGIGSTVDEGELREVRQHKIDGKWHVTTSDLSDTGFSDYWGLETRIAYTDAKSHDRHIRPFNTHNVRPLINQLVGEEISFSRFVELLNEIANDN